MKESQFENVDNQLLTVQQMILDIEWEAWNSEIINALRAGTDALNELHAQLDLEKVELLMEETEEALRLESQISDMLSGGDATSSGVSDEQLEEELSLLTAGSDAQSGSPQSSPDALASAGAAVDEQPTQLFPDVPSSLMAATHSAESSDHVHADGGAREGTRTTDKAAMIAV